MLLIDVFRDDSYLLIRKRPLGTWTLLSLYLELFSHWLIRKQTLGTWIFFINVFRVVFTLVEKKPLGTWFILINASRVDSYLLIRKRPLGTWTLLSMYLELFSHWLIRKQTLGTWIFFINVFRVVFTLVYKKTTSWDLVAIYQCIYS